MTFLCRDCDSVTDTDGDPAQTIPVDCPVCGRPRILRHPELFKLSIAHVDCDAFFAAVEKRDNPDLKNKPLIIGGGRRGVVSTACYIARMSGVRSAMPMFKARKLCPDAIVLKPDMAKYKTAGAQIREMFQALTPLVEPLSVDEAFLDLGGTERLHGVPPAIALCRLAREVEEKVGITISIGLAPNKFLAKLASDMDKPRGFTVIGQAEAKARLADMPVTRIFGIGKRTAARLTADGLTVIGQLQCMEQGELMRRYGSIGSRLYRLSRGEDSRTVKPERDVKSVSSETTLNYDVSAPETLEKILWKQCESVSAQLKRKKLAGQTVTLKVKTSVHKIRTRSRTLETPTQLADILFDTGRQLLNPLCDGTAYRLIGIGASHFRPLDEADPDDLIDTARTRRARAERAVDSLRDKFGKSAVVKGRSLK
ncbi:DNA polymerase IV [Eilatimonas milleporae]|uniref:DNA polymerase IV n=1 Tax=Eilatimonas milleporae TaxID=911205 RepID=A0A3M0C422_9PROT|nr:DNA polymerase IV [Eilatimonas milleporae]RMB04478.1 DNA polymerase-4 [Eilatimonas milleporae]